MKKVLLIVGSMREKAFNRQAALMAQKMLEKKADVSILSYEDLPQMNQDIEFPAPEAVHVSVKKWPKPMASGSLRLNIITAIPASSKTCWTG